MPSVAESYNAASRKFIGAVEDEWQLYSDRAEDYTIGASIGYGASSIVYAATFHPFNAPSSSKPTPCALKVVDLDRLPPHALHLLMQETQLMSLSKHPNVLRVRGTWMEGHKLYIALRLMNSGSAMDVMRYAWPGGMEEEVVRCILRQALQGLNYLHVNGLIHRDVKAANLLIDDDGTVLLGDLGVAAPLWEPSSNEETRSSSKRVIIDSSSFNRPGGGYVFISPAPHHAHDHPHTSKHPNSHSKRALGKRKSFVGTPCWMAPEVITGKQYDASADIWSFGITALELAHGRAPYSRSPPSVALTHIATSSAPKLDRTGGVNTYSAAFAEIVEMCLNKDPAKRPTAEELLSMSWFKGAKKKGYLVGTVLKDLPPLASRQERRRAPSLMTHATMDSWDFAMTQMGSPKMSSPTTSVYSARSGWRRRSDQVPEDPAEFDYEGGGMVEGSYQTGDTGVHALDGEDSATYARRMRTRHHVRTGSSGLHSRARSRSVSLAESIHEDEEAQSISGSPPAPSQISEAVSKFASKLQQTTQQGMNDLLDVPEISSPSTSPSASSSIGAAVTPPGSTHHDSVGVASSIGPSVTGSGTGRLWKKFVGITGKGTLGRGTTGENVLDSKDSRNATANGPTMGLSGGDFAKKKSGLGSRVRRGLLST